MTISIRYFAHLRAAIGRDQETVEVAENASVEDVVSDLSARHSELARLRPSLRFAVGTSFVNAGHMLTEGDELAVLTPVSGG